MREHNVCVLGFCGKPWQWRCYGGGFCEKLLEASTVPKGANGIAELWDNRTEKGETTVQQPATGERSGRTRENSCADTEVSEGGGRGAPEHRFPCRLIISNCPTLS